MKIDPLPQEIGDLEGHGEAGIVLGGLGGMDGNAATAQGQVANAAVSWIG